jgi:GDPmannose 4,6-dehydratase
LITGIGGQDGSYLAEFLLAKGYEVHGIDLPEVPLPNLQQIAERVVLHRGSLLSIDWLASVVGAIQPDECYHLAASSFVSYRFSDEAKILENNIGGTHHLLATLKEHAPQSRFFFAGTSEMFGHVEHSPQDETTLLRPRSVYGISKVAGHHLVEYYRQQYRYYACTGILYNHESPRRGLAFVTRKITSTAARISLGLESKLVLGNLEAERDWGYAPDYVQAMWLMLQGEAPADFVLSSGTLHTVREFVDAAFTAVGLNYRDFVETSPEFFREKEKIPLCGSSRRIEVVLGWRASKQFTEIVQEMVNADLASLKANETR